MLKPLAAMALSEATGAVKRRARAAGCYAVAGLFALIALVFGLWALHDWLVIHYLGPVAAKLSIAGGLLAVAGIIGLVGASAAKRPVESGATSPAGVAAAVAAAAPEIVGGATKLGVGALAAGAALIAATYLGHKLGRRWSGA